MPNTCTNTRRLRLPRALRTLCFATTLAGTLAGSTLAQFDQPMAPGERGYQWVGPKSGLWTGYIETPGGDVTFRIDIHHEGENTFDAAIVNGNERIPVTLLADADSQTFRFNIPHYDAHIRGVSDITGTILDGTYYITKGPDFQYALPFVARINPLPDQDPTRRQADLLVDAYENTLPEVWAIDFADEDHPAVGRFYTLPDGVNVQGTILTTTGDYRYLTGEWTGSELTLSTFDGAHAFLFKATRQDDGSLAGDFWSGPRYHTTWTATADPNATLPDPATISNAIAQPDWASLSFPDLDGNPTSLDTFVGQPLVIELMGSWCPNCHDAARVLADLKQEFEPQGLQVLAIAFEYTGEFERDAEQVRRYLQRHDLDIPALVAGTDDKDAATDALGFIDQVHAYPTAIFVRPDGTIAATHTGFSGPATGSDYDQTIRAYRDNINKILN